MGVWQEYEDEYMVLLLQGISWRSRCDPEECPQRYKTVRENFSRSIG